MTAILQHRVDKLIVSSVRSPHDALAAKTYMYDFERMLERLSHPVVVLTDLTNCSVVPQAAVGVHVKLMRLRSHQIIRSALLLRQRGVFSMQVERMVREAGDGERRVFWDRDEAERWLGQDLSQVERESLFGYLHHADLVDLSRLRPVLQQLRTRAAAN